MIRALVLKELRQHWPALLLVATLAGLGWLVLTVAAFMQGEVGSTLDVLRLFLLTFYVVAAMVLCNRLVVCEYQSKTQLFLEGLPISRLRMIAVKYVLGLVPLLAIVAAALAILLALGARSEPLTPRFVAIVAARTFAYSWCAYSAFFMMGLLGRYRVAIYLFAVVGVMAIQSITSLEPARFGPLALVNEQFAYERFEWPAEALAVTAALALGFVLLTAVLSLVREGSIASLMAEKMSHREKVFVAAMLLGFVFALYVFDERATKQPFNLPDAVAVAERGVAVKVSPGASRDYDRARRLAGAVAEEVGAVQDYLSIRELPPIFITQRRDLDPDRYERGVLDGAEGLLVRANFVGDGWRDERFTPWFVRELLVLASGGRAKLEPNAWVLDGFAHYRACPDADSHPAEYALLELRAAYGLERGFAAADAENWLSYRERVGEPIAGAVAWRGLVSLERARGAGALRAFLQSALDCNVPGDIRAVWHQWRHPVARLLAREAGIAHGEFVDLWLADLETLRQSRAAELARVPRLTGIVEFESISASSRVVKYAFTSDPAPERFTLIHAELPPFDDEVPESELHRVELRYEDERGGSLPQSYARGTRLYTTFAVRAEPLDCEIITGFSRRELE